MDIYKEYESWLIGDGKSEHTVTGYVRDLKLFAKWYEDSTGDKMEITKINQIDVAEYRNYLMQRSSANTVNRKIAVVKNFLDFGIYTGKIEHNAAERIKRAKTVKTAPKALTNADLRILKQALDEEGDPMHSALFALMIHAGLRVSEVVTVKMDRIHISPRNGWVKAHGKGDKFREVGLNSTAREMLETWYISRQQDKENPYLFPGTKPNSHMTTRAVQKIVSKYADRTKLNLTPHVMRHTFAKQLLDSGVSLDKVSAILGHARLDTTAIYTKCTQEELNEQTEKIAWN
jgi:site-specific recombinase XerD